MGSGGAGAGCSAGSARSEGGGPREHWGHEGGGPQGTRNRSSHACGLGADTEDGGTYNAAGRATPHQEAIFKQISDSLQVGSPASTHFMELMATMGYPGLQTQGGEGSHGQGAAGKSVGEPHKDRKQRPPSEGQAGKDEAPRSAAARSCSRRAREAKAKATASGSADGPGAAEAGEQPAGADMDL